MAEIIILCMQSSSNKAYSNESYKEFYETLHVREGNKDNKQPYLTVISEMKLEDCLEKVNLVEDKNGPYGTDELRKLLEDELESVYSYNQYLEEIQMRAETMSSLYIFRESGDFSQRNIIKTAERYKKLEELSPIPGPSKGAEMFSDNPVVGIVLVLCMMFLVNELVLKDKENGFIILSFATRNGRKKHGIAKLLVGFVSCFIITNLLMFVGYVTSDAIYGMGNLSRNVQSVAGLKGCPYTISILDYFHLSVIFRFVAAYVFFLVFFAVASGERTIVIYATVALVTGVETSLYYLISDNSYLVYLRRINLISFINTGGYLDTFYCLNFWGYPVVYVGIVVVVLVSLAFILIPLCIHMFSNQNPTSSMGRMHLPAFMYRIGSERVSTFTHEMRRIMVHGGVLLLLVFFALFQSVIYEPMKEYFEDEDAVYYKIYVTELQGPVTENKLLYIEAEKERIREAENEKQRIMENGYDAESLAAAASYQDRKIAWKNALKRLDDRKEKLLENGGDFIYETGMCFLTGNLGKDKKILLYIISSVMTVLCVSGLFANDDQIRLDTITNVCRNGRRKLYIKKYLTGLCILTVIWFLNWLPYYLNVIKTYGYAGMGSALVSLEHMEKSIPASLGLSIGGYLGFMCLFEYLVMVAEMTVISIVSKRIRSYSQTMIIGLSMFVGPLLITYAVII